MSKYLIESRHTPEECLRALDEILAQGADQIIPRDEGVSRTTRR